MFRKNKEYKGIILTYLNYDPLDKSKRLVLSGFFISQDTIQVQGRSFKMKKGSCTHESKRLFEALEAP